MGNSIERSWKSTFIDVLKTEMFRLSTKKYVHRRGENRNVWIEHEKVRS
jgi:hypothetical protein